jgi:hypothetical protein
VAQAPFIQIPFIQIPFIQIPLVVRLPFIQIPFIQIPFIQIPFIQIPFIQIPFIQIPFIQIPFIQIPFIQIPLVVRPFGRRPLPAVSALLVGVGTVPPPPRFAEHPPMQTATTASTAAHDRIRPNAALIDFSLMAIYNLTVRAFASQASISAPAFSSLP